jgi:dimethylhistidine N-methyltransferase
LEELTGLSEQPKRLSSRWFYDAVGSALFQQIMALDAYYPTDCEREILEAHAAAIAARFAGTELDLVDLGAGDGAKTVIMLDALREAGVSFRYVPIDVSRDAMVDLCARMEARYPGHSVQGLVADYVNGLRWLAEQDSRPRLVLFLGSNIGNFDKPRARAFLRRLWSGLSCGDHALIGFDLKKDIEVLLRAYNDPEGVTRAFNLNLLERINRELGGTFDISKWRHFGTYNVFTGAMESYLVSLERQSVHIESLRHSFEFQPWEPIHTEYSYKYLDEDISSLAEYTGFDVLETFLDQRGWFCDALWRVR